MKKVSSSLSHPTEENLFSKDRRKDEKNYEKGAKTAIAFRTLRNKFYSFEFKVGNTPFHSFF